MIKLQHLNRTLANGGVGLALFAGFALSALSTVKAADELPKEAVLPAAMALQAAQAALAHCAADGYGVGVAVVDRDGIIRAMVRGDGAPPHTNDSSRKKAYTAAAFKQPTGDVVQVIAQVPELEGMQNMNDDIIALGGGLPIEFAGEAVGGIGVAGAPGANFDDACAQAGLTAIGAEPKVQAGE